MRRLLVGALALAGCRAIPLNEDPTVARLQANVSRAAVYEVAWNRPLVKLGLLEYLPTEPASPAVDPDTERVYVATRDGFVRCLSPLDGHVEWEHKTSGRFVAGPTVDAGVLYVAGGDGNLYAFRAQSGQLLWSFKANEELVTSPTVADGKVYVASQSDTIFAVNAETGAWTWQYRRDAPAGFTVRGAARPTVGEGLVYMGFSDGYLVALDVGTGVAKWERRIAQSGGTQFLDVDSPAVLADGRLYVASYKDGVVALSAATGDLLWSTSQPGLTALMLRGSVLFATGDGALTAFEPSRGSLLWRVDLRDPTPKGRANNAGRALTMSRGYVVVPTSTSLAFVEPTSGKVRAMWNPGRGVTAAPTYFASPRHGSRLYVMSNLGTVFALQMVSVGG